MNSKPCNVVLLPSQSLGDIAIRASKALPSNQTLFQLEDGKYYPHISLYMLELRMDDYSKVEELLQNIADTQPIHKLTAVRYDQKMSFLDAEYSVMPELSHLQNTVLDTVSPIRNGIREKDAQRMQQAEGLKREYFEKYGYPNVKELFRPHITLTRFNHEALFDTALLPNISTFSGTFDRLGLFESGDNGTCVRLISAYALQ